MELHDIFSRWLVSGQEGSLPRDVAVHASACPACLRAAAAFDALAFVDPRSAPEPPVIDTAYADQRAKVVRGAMWAAGVTALLVIATTGVMAANGVFSPSLPAVAAASIAPTPGGSLTEGVLGNRRTPIPTTSDRSTPSAEASAGESGEAEPSGPPGIGAGAPAPTPTFWGPPLPGASAVPVPAPSVRPSPTPRATAAATATPTPTPTATPTPTPTPTPVPRPACSNFADDDGDGLVDFGNDPGCESAADNDERDPDTDADGVPDHLDQCPLDPVGLLPDPLRLGCPLIELP
jgi:hypothetical protein